MVEGHGGDRKTINIKSDNVTLDSVDRGNSKAYTVSRCTQQELPNDFKRLANSTQPTIPAMLCGSTCIAGT